MRMPGRPAALRFLLAQLLVLQPSSHGRRVATRTPYMRRMAKMFAEGIDVAERPDAPVDAGPRTKADLLTQAANNLVGEAREAHNPKRGKLFGDAISKYEAADSVLPNNYEILYFWAGAIAESSRAAQQAVCWSPPVWHSLALACMLATVRH